MSIYKTGREEVFALINAANPRTIKFDPTTSAIESVAAGSFTVDGVVYNTKAKLRGLPGAGYAGVQEVYYNRLDFRAMTSQTYVSDNSIQLVARSFSAASLHEALPSINNDYGLNLLPSDISNTPFPQPNVNNYITTQIFQILATSVLFAPTGSLVVQIRRGIPYLDQYVKARALAAYTHPATDVARKSAQMLTVGLDFTDYKNLLLVTGAGMPNFAALQQVLTQTHGLPAWDAPLNSNYVVDQPTSAVGNANKAFDRVVVQTGIDNGEVVGVAYYHYMA